VKKNHLAKAAVVFMTL